ncbi:MAG: hypothetical protein QGM46_06095 [Actinomycetota bacterium]|nr:hypothetical protein [Actinomycetota bacterium]MDK1017433.1 hypothetical protein [Actinomycetota bacterium]MDK1026917.1 hypothetical protein [Actinomycetota bacterium]MDK1038102.1 hypothetical protein [Actinomycetota bacterium]MDK1096428.1 hypothetical protein [Actinomycetota bacterium]
MSVAAAIAMKRAGIDADDFDVAGVTLRPMPSWMRVVLGPTVSTITLRRSIFVREDLLLSVVEGGRAGLLVHEFTHVDQWRREGVVSFVGQYAAEYVRNRLIGLDHPTAYRAISFEAAAFEAQGRRCGKDDA